MRIPDPAGKLSGPTPLWHTLERIRVSLSLTDGQFAELMRLTEKQFRRLREGSREPDVAASIALTERLNIGFDGLVRGELDYPALVRQFRGDQETLPERYAVDGQSKVRAMLNVLHYVESTYGWDRRARILRRFQMHEGMLHDPNAWINVRFGLDVLRHLREAHPEGKDGFQIGLNSAASYRGSPFARELAGAKDLREAYDRLGEGLISQYIEQNYGWIIARATRHECVVRGTPVAGAAEVGIDPLLCQVRAGFFASIPRFFGEAPARIRKSRCVSDGDPYCEIHVHFSRTA